MITKNQIWKLYGTDFAGMTKKLLEETELAALIGDKKTRMALSRIWLCRPLRNSAEPPTLKLWRVLLNICRSMD